MEQAIKHITNEFIKLDNIIRQSVRSHSGWSINWARMKKSKYRTQMAKNGQSKNERKRNQTMLRGRRCRAHKGGYPTRGKGTTSRSHR